MWAYVYQRLSRAQSKNHTTLRSLLAKLASLGAPSFPSVRRLNSALPKANRLPWLAVVGHSFDMRLPYRVFPVHPHHSHESLAVRYCLWISTLVLNLCLTMSPQATLLLSRRRTQYWHRFPHRQSLFLPFPTYAPLVARF